MPTTSTTITEQERAKRAQALVAAAGHLRLEDLHLDEELMRILQRHADGEIGDEELCAAVDELNHRRLGPMASSGNGSPPSEGAEEQVRVQATFDDLVKKWRRETRHLSTVSKMVLNHNYLRIIGLGDKAVPLLLRELEVRPNHWFTALSAITGENPVGEPSNFEEARHSWLNWGRARYTF